MPTEDKLRPWGTRRARRISRRVAKYGNGPVPADKKYPGRRAPKHDHHAYSATRDRQSYLEYGNVFAPTSAGHLARMKNFQGGRHGL